MNMDLDCEYRNAETAYMLGHYGEAAAIIDLLTANFPDNPRLHLFRGYIYNYGLQEYEIARQEYELVLALAPEDVELINTVLQEIIYVENLLKSRED